MIATEVLRTLEGEAIQENIVKPLTEMLTSMNKYTVSPIYFVQFLVNKINLMPKMVLVSYDNRSLMIETASSVPHMEDVMNKKFPKTITPSAIVYPEELSLKDVVFNKNENYYYSTSYLISGKEIKDAIKKGIFLFTKVIIKSDIDRKHIETEVIWQEGNILDEQGNKINCEIMIQPIPDSIKALKLPFSNYSLLAKDYVSIVNEVANNYYNKTVLDDSVSEDKIKLNDILTKVKTDFMIPIPGDENVKIFKDFYKIKPNKFSHWSSVDKNSNGENIRKVCLNYYFKNNKCGVVLFYAYIDDLIDEIVGIYSEEEKGILKWL